MLCETMTKDILVKVKNIHCSPLMHQAGNLIVGEISMVKHDLPFVNHCWLLLHFMF